MDGLAWYVGSGYRWMAESLQPCAGLALKDNVEENNLSTVEFWAVYLVIHFMRNKKWPEVRIYTNFWFMMNPLTKGLEEK